MSDQKGLTWEPDELEKVLAARRVELDEKSNLLIASLRKPLPGVDQSGSRSTFREHSAMMKQIDAHLKALQDLVRSLPPRNSITG
jgi:hypothetical protein